MTAVVDRGEAVWASGRLDARAGPRRVLFGHMFEDVAIEQAAFRPGGRIFCIASAGCTAIHLARTCTVVAVDVNAAQVAYVRERLAGAPARSGTVERGMAMARRVATAAGWSAERVRAFLELDDPTEQIAFWRRHLATRRFRMGMDCLLSPAALSFVYARPLRRDLPEHFGRVLRRRLERGIARHANRRNPYARALFAGEFVESPPGPFHQEIRLVHADAVDFLDQEPAGVYDGFTISNILDGVSEDYRERLRASIRRSAAPGATCVLRSFAEPAGDRGSNRAAEDRSMLWGTVTVEPATTS